MDVGNVFVILDLVRLGMKKRIVSEGVKFWAKVLLYKGTWATRGKETMDSDGGMMLRWLGDGCTRVQRR